MVKKIKKVTDRNGNYYEPYIGDDGIYCPMVIYEYDHLTVYNQLIISKEMLIEAYNKWIKE